MRVYAGAGAVIGWFALALQLVLLVIVDSEISVAGRIVNFFSYFTILSNILAAIALSVVALGLNGSALGRFFCRRSVQTGITVYITVTGVIYFLILRTIWDPEGWALVADSLLHYAMPIIFVGFWLFFVTKGTLAIRNVPWFLAFPMLYAAYSLVRGPFVPWYPYPFLDAGALTTGELIVNIAVMLVGFGLVALAYVGLDRWLARA